ncbi:MAG: addiction module protein [Planctomycetota bacterium]
MAAEDREVLARDLILSLEDEPYDPPEEVEAAWADEIRRRAAEVHAGQPGIPAEQVLEEARARLKERRGR